MAPSRTSRKNKKAWRRNVDVTDLEEGLERKAAARVAAAQAAAEAAAADAELFFVDKGGVEATTATTATTSTTTTATTTASRRRLKGAAALKRPLRCQLVTARPPVARRVPARLEKPPKKKKKSTKEPPPTTDKKTVLSSTSTSSALALASPTPKRLLRDEETGLPLSAPEDVWKGNSKTKKKENVTVLKNVDAAEELAAATATAAARRAVASLGPSARSFLASSAAEVVLAPKSGGVVKPRRRRPPRVAPIPAVEVDAAGCSYNPDAEQHQDAVGAAVAAELAKEAARRALKLAAPPRLVDAPDDGLGGRDELSRLLADTAEAFSSSSDDDDGDEGEGEGEGESSDDDGDGDETSSSDDNDDGEGKRSRNNDKKQPRRKTTAERNRAARHRARELELAQRKASKSLASEIASLPKLKRQLAAAEEARAASLARRAADREERAKERPPHLGRKKWTQPDIQVLPTDELKGSLLRLRPCAAVARDRFSSLQKRGVIEVRTPAAKKNRAVKLYEPEGRTDRLVASQEALDEVKRANREKMMM